MNVYDEIFATYVKELRAAKAEVLEWWDALMAAASPSGDFEEAQQGVRPRWPAGPASHPRIIDVFRRHYLMIEDLNERLEDEWYTSGDDPGSGWGQTDQEGPRGGLHPSAVLLERLDEDEPELGEFMANFVFVSIGIDPEGRTT